MFCVTIFIELLSMLYKLNLLMNVKSDFFFCKFRKGIRTEDNRQFLNYCAYAFGIPVLISITNFILNNFELIPDSINNGIGHETCSIPQKRHDLLWIYIYGPIMVMLIVNITFYAITAWKILYVQKETSKICKATSSQKHSKDNHIRYS
jgi:hypothetical protein